VRRRECGREEVRERELDMKNPHTERERGGECWSERERERERD